MGKLIDFEFREYAEAVSQVVVEAAGAEVVGDAEPLISGIRASLDRYAMR